eukprot:Em0006g1219a
MLHREQQRRASKNPNRVGADFHRTKPKEDSDDWYCLLVAFIWKSLECWIPYCISVGVLSRKQDSCTDIISSPTTKKYTNTPRDDLRAK